MKELLNVIKALSVILAAGIGLMVAIVLGVASASLFWHALNWAWSL